MQSPALELRGIAHDFGSLRAVDDLHLTVDQGTVFGFLGLNGAGKTTTLRIILGLIRPRAGEVKLFGRPATGGDPVALARVGVLFEDFAAYPYLSGYNHLRLQAQLLGMSKREATRAAGEWLERVGLGEAADRRVSHYSLGMTRRLGLACALVHRPTLVFLDEPTNGLDPEGVRDFRELLLELNRESGTTFFLSSHVLGEVEKVCGRVGILHRGRLRCEGAIDELTAGAADGGRVRITVGDGARARAVLASEPWCKSVAAESANRDAPPVTGEMALELELEAEPGARAAGAAGASLLARIAPALVAAGVDLLALEPGGRSLEDVFRQTLADAEDAA